MENSKVRQTTTSSKRSHNSTVLTGSKQTIPNKLNDSQIEISDVNGLNTPKNTTINKNSSRSTSRRKIPSSICKEIPTNFLEFYELYNTEKDYYNAQEEWDSIKDHLASFFAELRKNVLQKSDVKKSKKLKFKINKTSDTTLDILRFATVEDIQIAIFSLNFSEITKTVLYEFVKPLVYNASIFIEDFAEFETANILKSNNSKDSNPPKEEIQDNFTPEDLAKINEIGVSFFEKIKDTTDQLSKNKTMDNPFNKFDFIHDILTDKNFKLSNIETILSSVNKENTEEMKYIENFVLHQKINLKLIELLKYRESIIVELDITQKIIDQMILEKNRLDTSDINFPINPNFSEKIENLIYNEIQNAEAVINKLESRIKGIESLNSKKNEEKKNDYLQKVFDQSPKVKKIYEQIDFLKKNRDDVAEKPKQFTKKKGFEIEIPVVNLTGDLNTSINIHTENDQSITNRPLAISTATSPRLKEMLKNIKNDITRSSRSQVAKTVEEIRKSTELILTNKDYQKSKADLINEKWSASHKKDLSNKTSQNVINTEVSQIKEKSLATVSRYKNEIEWYDAIITKNKQLSKYFLDFELICLMEDFKELKLDRDYFNACDMFELEQHISLLIKERTKVMNLENKICRMLSLAENTKWEKIYFTKCNNENSKSPDNFRNTRRKSCKESKIFNAYKYRSNLCNAAEGQDIENISKIVNFYNMNFDEKDKLRQDVFNSKLKSSLAKGVMSHSNKFDKSQVDMKNKSKINDSILINPLKKVEEEKESFATDIQNSRFDMTVSHLDRTYINNDYSRCNFVEGFYFLYQIVFKINTYKILNSFYNFFLIFHNVFDNAI